MDNYQLAILGLIIVLIIFCRNKSKGSSLYMTAEQNEEDVLRIANRLKLPKPRKPIRQYQLRKAYQGLPEGFWVDLYPGDKLPKIGSKIRIFHLDEITRSVYKKYIDVIEDTIFIVQKMRYGINNSFWIVPLNKSMFNIKKVVYPGFSIKSIDTKQRGDIVMYFENELFLNNAFNSADENNDRLLSENEISNIGEDDVSNLYSAFGVEAPNLTMEDIASWDINQSETLDFEEFYNGISNTMN